MNTTGDEWLKADEAGAAEATATWARGQKIQELPSRERTFRSKANP